MPAVPIILSPAQKRTLKLLQLGKMAYLIPGGSISFGAALGNMTISRRVLKTLKTHGLITESNSAGSFSAHKVSLSPKGKSYLKFLEGK